MPAVLAEGTKTPEKIVNCLAEHTTARLGDVYCPSVRQTIELTITGANPNAAPWCLCYWCTLNYNPDAFLSKPS